MRGTVASALRMTFSGMRATSPSMLHAVRREQILRDRGLHADPGLHQQRERLAEDPVEEWLVEELQSRSHDAAASRPTSRFASATAAIASSP